MNLSGGEGAEVIYALRNNNRLASLILEKLGEKGEPIRKIYQRRLPSDQSKDYYFIHRNTGYTEPVIVEYGFLDNVNDANRIKNNYKNYVEGVIEAVAEYKGFDYKKPRLQDEYIVEKGDTLWNISKKLDTTVNELKNLNNLNSNLLYIGQVLKVPNYYTATDSNTFYIVKKGDTLYSLSKKFGISIDELKRINNLNSDLLNEGMEISIPSTESIVVPSEDEVINEGSVYVVQKGDTLYSIAKKFNTTIDTIKNSNSLISDILSIGMNLLIPSNNIADVIIHKVAIGDSLWSLASKYNTTIDDIKKLNNLISDLLVVGQDIQVKRNTK